MSQHNAIIFGGPTQCSRIAGASKAHAGRVLEIPHQHLAGRNRRVSQISRHIDRLELALSGLPMQMRDLARRLTEVNKLYDFSNLKGRCTRSRVVSLGLPGQQASGHPG